MNRVATTSSTSYYLDRTDVCTLVIIPRVEFRRAVILNRTQQSRSNGPTARKAILYFHCLYAYHIPPRVATLQTLRFTPALRLSLDNWNLSELKFTAADSFRLALATNCSILLRKTANSRAKRGHPRRFPHYVVRTAYTYNNNIRLRSLNRCVFSTHSLAELLFHPRALL